jgi:hypothetical protein
MRWSLWLGAGPLALSLAAGVGERDRAEGIDALVTIRGGSPFGLSRARLLAAIGALWVRIGLPLWVVCLVLLPLRPSRAAAWLVAAVPALALGAAMVLAVAALACARYGAGRGRLLFLGVVLLPWVVVEVTGAGVSLPGAFGTVLDALGASMAALWGWGAGG